MRVIIFLTEGYLILNHVELSQRENEIHKEEQAMAFKIGFSTEHPENKPVEDINIVSQQAIAPRKSVVQVHFAGRNMTLAYYNDQFDLRPGDLVYVDGAFEGLLGRVIEVNYNFKIRLSEYKRVVAVVDTKVSGQFFMAGSHFITFDRDTLPANKVASWYFPPDDEDEEIVSGSDDSHFSLSNLVDFKISNAVAERGRDYYVENKVRYLSHEYGKGYAIVEGSQPYEVEFEYHDSEISELTCSCFCCYNCKHEVAALLQLRETLAMIEEDYLTQYMHTDYFAAINKSTLFAFAIEGRENGSFTL